MVKSFIILLLGESKYISVKSHTNLILLILNSVSDGIDLLNLLVGCFHIIINNLELRIVRLLNMLSLGGFPFFEYSGGDISPSSLSLSAVLLFLLYFVFFQDFNFDPVTFLPLGGKWVLGGIPLDIFRVARGIWVEIFWVLKMEICGQTGQMPLSLN